MRIATLLQILLLLWLPGVTHANTGISTFAVVWPASWFLLIPVVMLEALVAKRMLPIDARASLRLSLVGNLWSTIVGLPITWFLVFAAGIVGHIVAIGLGPSDSTSLSILKILLHAPGHMTWLKVGGPEFIYLVAAALCIPFAYASAWIEAKYAHRFLPNLEWAQVHRWSRSANFLSYGIIILILVLRAVWM